METVLFYLLGAVSLAAAVAVVVVRRVFYSAIALIVCLTAVAGLYMLLEAPFIAAVQVIVYAGAIMVLFLFVIMLLDPFSGGVHPDRSKRLKFVAPLLAMLCLLALYPMIMAYDLATAPRPGQQAPSRGSQTPCSTSTCCRLKPPRS